MSAGIASRQSSQNMSASQSKWKWENATAGVVAGFATVAAMHPLDVVRTRFQANDDRVPNLPTYKNTAQDLYTIARSEPSSPTSVEEELFQPSTSFVSGQPSRRDHLACPQ